MKHIDIADLVHVSNTSEGQFAKVHLGYVDSIGTLDSDGSFWQRSVVVDFGHGVKDTYRQAGVGAWVDGEGNAVTIRKA